MQPLEKSICSTNTCTDTPTYVYTIYSRVLHKSCQSFLNIFGSWINYKIGQLHKTLGCIMVFVDSILSGPSWYSFSGLCSHIWMYLSFMCKGINVGPQLPYSRSIAAGITPHILTSYSFRSAQVSSIPQSINKTLRLLGRENMCRGWRWGELWEFLIWSNAS